ncbi:cytochrome b/b6 domain-containing protein [Clostridium chromiireducens]|uniref:Cytochrome b/b6 domain-containing protein n=1 Tax=Clostridium chromiireducens TaxID=225345 RepID=A0A399IG44_9CLOT|nr:cytochrome b/b6 domain-containing protein [Clostridium chromiireducens]RII31825.1 cytochrome b/b6 domain-containing protein [Clostridium chromiireducens]
MNIRFDFVMHWLYAIVWALLAISGFAMVGAKYGWLLNFDIASADYIHRVSAGAFVIITLISIIYEIYKNIKNDQRPLPWFIIGKKGYQLFTFIMTLILIITGAIIWVCMEYKMPFVSFALFIHEYVSYIFLASIIWHIYKKCHILLWPKKSTSKKIEK